MRIALILAAAAGSLLIPSLAVSQPAPQPNGPLTTTDDQTKSTVGNAASAPMHDLNVMREKIPPVLLQAIADPYARPTPATCSAIIGRVRELTNALGDDLDIQVDEDPTMRERGAGAGREIVRAGAESLLPFRGFVRRLSGAEQHDKLVLQAITAGSVRRGYLKGLGEARGCPPPGTPKHLVHAPEPVVEGGQRRPQYPTH